MKKLSWIVLLFALTTNAFALTWDAPVASKLQDGSGNAITSTGAALDVNLKTAGASLGRTWTLGVGTDTVAATLSAETTKVIGTVNISAAQTIAATQSGTWTLGAGSAVIGHVINDAGSAVIGHVIVDSGSITTGASTPETRSDTFTVAANGVTVDAHLAPVKYMAIQCKGTGAAPTAWSIVLEGSLDNTNFTTILTHANTSLSDGQTLYSGTTATPVLYFRSRLVSVTLGSATNIVCVILGL